LIDKVLIVGAHGGGGEICYLGLRFLCYVCGSPVVICGIAALVATRHVVHQRGAWWSIA